MMYRRRKLRRRPQQSDLFSAFPYTVLLYRGQELLWRHPLLHRDRLHIEQILDMEFVHVNHRQPGTKNTLLLQLVQDNENSSDDSHLKEDQPVPENNQRKRPPPSDMPYLSTPPPHRAPRVEASTDETVPKSTLTQVPLGSSAVHYSTPSTSGKPLARRFPRILADLMTDLGTNQLQDWIRWDITGTAVLVKHMKPWQPVTALRPYFAHCSVQNVKTSLARYGFGASKEDG
jgi:hypothetical protein